MRRCLAFPRWRKQFGERLILCESVEWHCRKGQRNARTCHATGIVDTLTASPRPCRPSNGPSSCRLEASRALGCMLPVLELNDGPTKSSWSYSIKYLKYTSKCRRWQFLRPSYRCRPAFAVNPKTCERKKAYILWGSPGTDARNLHSAGRIRPAMSQVSRRHAPTPEYRYQTTHNKSQQFLPISHPEFPWRTLLAGSPMSGSKNFETCILVVFALEAWRLLGTRHFGIAAAEIGKPPPQACSAGRKHTRLLKSSVRWRPETWDIEFW